MYLNHDQSNSFILALQNTSNVSINSFSLSIFENFETDDCCSIFISFLISDCVNYIAIFPRSIINCSFELSLLDFSTLLNFEIESSLENTSIFSIDKPLIFRLKNSVNCIMPNSSIELPIRLKSSYNSKIKIIIEYSFHDYNVSSFCSASQFCRKSEILLNVKKEHGIKFSQADLIFCPRDIIPESEFQPFLIPPFDNSKFQLLLNVQNICNDYFNLSVFNNKISSVYLLEKKSERLIHIKFDKFSDEFSNHIRNLLNNDSNSIDMCLQLISNEFIITWESKNNTFGSIQLYDLWRGIDRNVLISMINNCLSDTLLISFFKDNNLSSTTLSLEPF